jgi:hypothetical protein
MEPSYTYHEFLPLPRGTYSVIIYYSFRRNNYVLEVLRKKGVKFTAGGDYFPRGIMGMNLDDEEAKELQAVGFEMRKNNYESVSAVQFVKTIERNQLAESIRLTAKLKPKEKEI